MIKYRLRKRKNGVCIICKKHFVSNNISPKFCSRKCCYSKAPIERFWIFVNKTDTCWMWIGSRNNNGYGKFKVGSHLISSHRFIFETINGPIPPGKIIRHSCDNPICVNPDHLLVGTCQDNINDKCARGRVSRLNGEQNPNAKLLKSDIPMIRKLYKDGLSQKEIGILFGVVKQSISHIMSQKTWHHII